MDVEQFLSRLEGVYRSGENWMAQCPAHPDQSQSLSVGVGRDARVLVWCHAGCKTSDVLVAMGLTVADLFARPGRARRPA